MTRREVREVTFMMLFQLEFRQDISIEDTLAQYYTIDIESTDEEENLPKVKLSESDRNYIQTIVDGVIKNKSELDGIISLYAKGWTLERIIKVDLSVLRYCIYEMKYINSIPKVVSVNEALNLAKIYSTEKSSKFINGILSNFMGE